MSAEPLLVVLIGPGGVGKGTIARRLIETDDRLWLSRSWTTRPRRPTEAGTEYAFVDRASFDTAIASGDFFEWAEFHGNLYGTPWPAGQGEADVVLEIEVQGAEQILRQRRDAVVFLILPPTMDDLEDRLRTRGDSDEQVARRLSSTPDELARGHSLADFVIVNDDLERATKQIVSILEGLRAQRRNPPKED